MSEKLFDKIYEKDCNTKRYYYYTKNDYYENSKR